MALAIASRVGDISRFPSGRSLANFFGLTPGSRSSGETQRLGSITKEGSPQLRFLLVQLVLHVLRRDARMRAWFKRIKQRRGVKIARVAVMRRLAVIMWHMLSKQEAYRHGGAPQRTRGDCEQPLTEAELTAHRDAIRKSFAQATAVAASSPDSPSAALEAEAASCRT
jgi:hypothetical protein